MKDLTGRYRHATFNQIWEIQRMGRGGVLYSIKTYSLEDESQSLGSPIHILELNVKELIDAGVLIQVAKDKNSFSKFVEKMFSGK